MYGNKFIDLQKTINIDCCFFLNEIVKLLFVTITMKCCVCVLFLVMINTGALSKLFLSQYSHFRAVLQLGLDLTVYLFPLPVGNGGYK